MGLPDSAGFSEQSQLSLGFSENVQAENAANKCLPGSTPMIHKEFNQVYCLTMADKNVSFLAPDKLLLNQLSDSNPLKSNDAKKPEMCEKPKEPEVPKLEICEAYKYEKRGPLDVTVNKLGQITSIRDKQGNYFTRQADGNYLQHFKSGSERVVKNMDIDKHGNMKFDSYPGTAPHHYEVKADGSYSVKSDDLGGKLSYDSNGRLTEAPAGDGKNRKFHYTNGQLDQIDGRLGHWDRVVKNGLASWVNKNTGAVWEGDFVVNPSTNNLEFRGRNGAAWNFTTHGKDVQATVKPKQI